MECVTLLGQCVGPPDNTCDLRLAGQREIHLLTSRQPTRSVFHQKRLLALVQLAMTIESKSMSEEGSTYELWGGGKVTKRVVKAGTGPRPQPGMRVVIHYHGLLDDGTLFDSSRGNGRSGFAFELGGGSVIPGMDVGVAAMHEGEASVLTMEPEFAYGEARTGAIPPNSRLTFQIELIEVGDARSLWAQSKGHILGLLAMVAVLALFAWLNQWS